MYSYFRIRVILSSQTKFRQRGILKYLIWLPKGTILIFIFFHLFDIYYYLMLFIYFLFLFYICFFVVFFSSLKVTFFLLLLSLKFYFFLFCFNVLSFYFIFSLSHVHVSCSHWSLLSSCQVSAAGAVWSNLFFITLRHYA